MSNPIKEFIDVIKEPNEEVSKTYEAIVAKVDEEGIVWVNLVGSDKETPTASTSTEVKSGDLVNVEWRNNRLYIAGNYSNPSAGVVRVVQVESTANDAKQTADAVEGIAEAAQQSANTASAAAAQAVYDAGQASAAATAAQNSANAAQTSADNASEYASRALGNLSTVQSVTETLTWITQHGTMALTTDTALDPTHVYFVRDANGDYTVGSYTYSVVAEPNINDIGTYYELTIDESLNNYVGTHLALTSEGLWLLPTTGNAHKVLIAVGGAGHTYPTAGTYIIDSGGNTVASFGANSIQLGKVLAGKYNINIGASTGIQNKYYNSVLSQFDYKSVKFYDGQGTEETNETAELGTVTTIGKKAKPNIRTRIREKGFSVGAGHENYFDLNIQSLETPLTHTCKEVFYGSDGDIDDYILSTPDPNNTTGYFEVYDQYGNLKSTTQADFSADFNIRLGTPPSDPQAVDTRPYVYYNSTGNYLSITYDELATIYQTYTIELRYQTTIDKVPKIQVGDGDPAPYGMSIGRGLIGTDNCSLVLGTYNTWDQQYNDKEAFIIGNGNASQRSNAFVVDVFGQAEADTFYSEKTDGKAFQQVSDGSGGSTDTGLQATRTDTNVGAFFGVGGGGNNHGIYSNKHSRWMIYDDASGATKLQASSVKVNGNEIATKATLTSQAYDTPTSGLTVNGSSTSSQLTQTQTKSGYYPLGIVGHQLLGSQAVNLTLIELQMSARASGSVTVRYRIRNNASSNSTNTYIHYWVLWIKE